MKKAIAAALSCILAVSSITGCSFTGKTDTGASGTGAAKTTSLTTYVQTEIPSLNQLAVSDDISFTVLNNISEGLYRLDKDDQPQPALAKSVKISDDKLTYTFTLRDGIKWSNGDPVTSKDFKTAWLKGMTTEATNNYSFILTDYIVKGLEYSTGKAKADDVGIKTPDDKTLEVHLIHATPYFLRLTAFVPYFPLNEKFYTAQGKNYGVGASNVITCGPYNIKSFDTAAGATLVKNSNYWDAASVKIDTVNMKVIKDQSTALNLYKANQLSRVTLSATDVPNYINDKEYSTLEQFRTYYLQFNTKADGVSNENIRKALSYAIDTKTMCSTVLKNGSENADGLIPTKMSSGDGATAFRSQAGAVVSFDAAKAKEYWAKGVKELGKTPKLTVILEDTSEAKDVATFLQSQFKQNLGVDVTIDSKTKKARNALMDANNFQMGITAWGADYDDPMTYMELWTNHTPYRGNFNNAEYDKLVEDAKSETDTAKRAGMLEKAEKILVEQNMIISPLYYGGSAILTKSNVKGLVTHPCGSGTEFKYASIQ